MADVGGIQSSLKMMEMTMETSFDYNGSAMRPRTVDLYSEENIFTLARLLFSVWGPQSVMRRAANMSNGNPRGIRLAAEVDRLIERRTT